MLINAICLFKSNKYYSALLCKSDVFVYVSKFIEIFSIGAIHEVLKVFVYVSKLIEISEYD